MTDANELRWVATISDGSTAVEHSGKYQIIPGERKPWIRLMEHLEGNDLHLTSLRLNFRGRTIHMPRLKFDRFDMNERFKAPLFYSLQYHIEGEFLDDGTFGQTDFIDLAAHYEDFTIHFIQDTTDGSNSWLVVTDGNEALAPSPRA